MPAKQITHEANGLTAVFREKLGSDVLDAPSVHLIIAQHIATQMGIADTSKIPNRFWGRIVFVTNVIQQTVSLAGDDRFDIPSIDSSSEDIIDFYEFMMVRDEETIDFFRDGFKKFDPIPLTIGANNGS